MTVPHRRAGGCVEAAAAAGGSSSSGLVIGMPLLGAGVLCGSVGAAASGAGGGLALATAGSAAAPVCGRGERDTLGVDEPSAVDIAVGSSGSVDLGLLIECLLRPPGTVCHPPGKAALGAPGSGADILRAEEYIFEEALVAIA